MPRHRRRLKRNARRLLITSLVTLIVVGAGLSYVWWRRSLPAPTPQPTPPVAETPTEPVVPPTTPPTTPSAPTTPKLTGGKIDSRGAIPVVTSGPTGANRVALTFDGGWEYVQTQSLLDALAAADVKATFFLRGAWIEGHADLAKAIAAGGHEIESHSYAHSDMTKLTDAEAKSDLDHDQAAHLSVLGHSPDYFRPPYGASNAQLLTRLTDYGIKGAIMWTIDTIDWKSPGTDVIVNRASGATDGAIILMHIGGAQTVEALPRVIAALRAKGLTPVTLTQLLGDRLSTR